MDVLTDHQTRQWNASMVDGMFVPHEAKMIKKIPLSRVCQMAFFTGPFLRMEGTIVGQVTGF